MAVINAKRVYRIMRQNALLLERKPEIPPSKRAHTAKWPLEKVTSGGALTASSSAVITVKNCGSRSLWTVAIARHFTGRPVTVDMTVKPQDVMLGAVERRFGNSLPTSPLSG